MVSKELILYYYSLIGYDLDKLDFSYLTSNILRMSDLIPDDLIHYPVSSQEISHLFLGIITDLNFLLENGEISYFIHQEIISSIMIICDAGLKLVGQKNPDYLLNFNRQNEIIKTLLKSIRKVGMLDLIDLATYINRKQYKEILKGNRFPYEFSFLLALSVTGDYDIGSKIFNEDSYKIDMEKLFVTLQHSLDIYAHNLKLGIIREKTNCSMRIPYNQEPLKSKQNH